jgi:hypothetical protein
VNGETDGNDGLIPAQEHHSEELLSGDGVQPEKSGKHIRGRLSFIIKYRDRAPITRFPGYQIPGSGNIAGEESATE